MGAQHGLEVLMAIGFERAANLHAGIVHQNVDRADFAFAMVHGLGHAVGAGDVEGQCRHLCAALGQISRRFAQSHLVPAIQYQFGTGTGQSPCHGKTQPAAGTGDQRPAASEVEWRSLFSHAWRVLASMARLSGVS
ncbi:hypothetical protein D3C87_1513800 [compost metagenome]